LCRLSHLLCTRFVPFAGYQTLGLAVAIGPSLRDLVSEYVHVERTESSQRSICHIYSQQYTTLLIIMSTIQLF